MIPRPDTFDPWLHVAWVKECESELHVQVRDPASQQLMLKPLTDLSPKEWAYHAQRLFMDPRHPCKAREEWEA